MISMCETQGWQCGLAAQIYLRQIWNLCRRRDMLPLLPAHCIAQWAPPKSTSDCANCVPKVHYAF